MSSRHVPPAKIFMGVSKDVIGLVTGQVAPERLDFPVEVLGQEGGFVRKRTCSGASGDNHEEDTRVISPWDHHIAHRPVESLSPS